MNVKVKWLTLLVLIGLILMVEVSNAYPMSDTSADATMEISDSVKLSHSHHHHHKHHIRHKHRRRSLTSEEETKTQRNKQVMLTKPYWPWP